MPGDPETAEAPEAAEAVVPTITSPAGSVSVNLACVTSNAFELRRVRVSVEGTFSATLVGANAAVTRGAATVTVGATGQASALLPALAGVVAARVIAPAASTGRVAVSMAPIESVTVNLIDPAAPSGVTVACGAVAVAAWIATPPLATQEYAAMLRPHAATLPEASSTMAPPPLPAGNATAAMGRCAASTARNAFTMPAPHSLPSLGHAHSPLDGSVFGHTGSPAGCGNATALDSIRAINCAGVRFAFTARINAATPATMGAEKLVPRLGLISSV